MMTNARSPGWPYAALPGRAPAGRVDVTTEPEAVVPRDRRATKLAYLSELELFHDFTPPEMAELERITAMVTCDPGRVFFVPGETGEVLFVLKRGRVALYRLSSEGRKLVIATLERGSVFGELSLIGQGMYDAFAEAVEPCLLCVMSRTDVERLLLGKPRVALRLMAQMGQRLQEAETQLEELAFKGLPARLAGLLLRLAERRETPREVVGYSHQELADLLGVYRESITSKLDSFKAEGIVAIGRRRIELLHPDRLRELASRD